MSKPRFLTFAYHDSVKNVLSTVQWKSMRRTVEEAWGDVLMFLANRHSTDLFHAQCRFSRVFTFAGLVEVMDESIPLRKSTPEEVEAQEKAPV